MQRRRHHLPRHEVVEGDLHQPVAPDDDRRARGHPRGRSEAGSAIEPEVEPRLGLGEGTCVDLAARGKEDEEVDQFLVGVGNCRPVDERAVDQLEEDVVVADDDDVLDPVVIHQWLEPTEPEQGVEDRLGGGLLARQTPGDLTGVDCVSHRRLDEIQHDRPTKLLLRGLVESTPVGCDRLAQLL